jgi:hypothetical protein
MGVGRVEGGHLYMIYITVFLSFDYLIYLSFAGPYCKTLM